MIWVQVLVGYRGWSECRYRSDTDDDLSSGSGLIQRMIWVQVLVGYRGWSEFRFWSDTNNDLSTGSGRIQRMIWVQVQVGYRGWSKFRFWSDTKNDLSSGSGQIRRMIWVQIQAGEGQFSINFYYLVKYLTVSTFGWGCPGVKYYWFESLLLCLNEGLQAIHCFLSSLLFHINSSLFSATKGLGYLIEEFYSSLSSFCKTINIFY